MTSLEGTISISKFDGTNFHLWKLKARMILEELELWSIIEGTERRPQPQDDVSHFTEKLSTWQKKNAKARRIICLNLADGQLQQVQYTTNAKEAWDKLVSIYEAKDLNSCLFLRRWFFTSQMNEGESMVKYISCIQEMAERLAFYWCS